MKFVYMKYRFFIFIDCSYIIIADYIMTRLLVYILLQTKGGYMASKVEFVEYVCEILSKIGVAHYRALFGEYAIYLNNKPVAFVCNDTVYIRNHKILEGKLDHVERGYPFHWVTQTCYILDVEDREFFRHIISLIASSVKTKLKKNKSLIEYIVKED